MCVWKDVGTWLCVPHISRGGANVRACAQSADGAGRGWQWVTWTHRYLLTCSDASGGFASLGMADVEVTGRDIKSGIVRCRS